MVFRSVQLGCAPGHHLQFPAHPQCGGSRGVLVWGPQAHMIPPSRLPLYGPPSPVTGTLSQLEFLEEPSILSMERVTRLGPASR